MIRISQAYLPIPQQPTRSKTLQLLSTIKIYLRKNHPYHPVPKKSDLPHFPPHHWPFVSQNPIHADRSSKVPSINRQRTKAVEETCWRRSSSRPMQTRSWQSQQGYTNWHTR